MFIQTNRLWSMEYELSSVPLQVIVCINIANRNIGGRGYSRDTKHTYHSHSLVPILPLLRWSAHLRFPRKSFVQLGPSRL